MLFSYYVSQEEKGDKYMNFAVPFMRQFKYLNDSVELNIKYKPQIKKLLNFIEVYGESHRINIEYEEFTKEDIKIFKALIEKFPNYKIIACLPSYSKDLEQLLVQNEIPHYYKIFITNWERFRGFLTLQVTDIFLAEALMFDIKNVKQAVGDKPIALRSYCNICEGSWDDTPSVKKFFIRPEDIPLYENLIDTFEFFLPEQWSTASRLNILYQVFCKEHKWFGKFNEIIVGYQGQEDSKFFVSLFGERRLTCKQRCMSQSQPTCHICDRIISLAEAFKDKNYIVEFDNI